MLLLRLRPRPITAAVEATRKQLQEALEGAMTSKDMLRVTQLATQMQQALENVSPERASSYSAARSNLHPHPPQKNCSDARKASHHGVMPRRGTTLASEASASSAASAAAAAAAAAVRCSTAVPKVEGRTTRPFVIFFIVYCALRTFF